MQGSLRARYTSTSASPPRQALAPGQLASPGNSPSRPPLSPAALPAPHSPPLATLTRGGIISSTGSHPSSILSPPSSAAACSSTSPGRRARSWYSEQRMPRDETLPDTECITAPACVQYSSAPSRGYGQKWPGSTKEDARPAPAKRAAASPPSLPPQPQPQLPGFDGATHENSNVDRRSSQASPTRAILKQAKQRAPSSSPKDVAVSPGAHVASPAKRPASRSAGPAKERPSPPRVSQLWREQHSPPHASQAEQPSPVHGAAASASPARRSAKVHMSPTGPSLSTIQEADSESGSQHAPPSLAQSSSRSRGNSFGAGAARARSESSSDASKRSAPGPPSPNKHVPGTKVMRSVDEHAKTPRYAAAPLLKSTNTSPFGSARDYTSDLSACSTSAAASTSDGSVFDAPPPPPSLSGGRSVVTQTTTSLHTSPQRAAQSQRAHSAGVPIATQTTSSLHSECRTAASTPSAHTARPGVLKSALKPPIWATAAAAPTPTSAVPRNASAEYLTAESDTSMTSSSSAGQRTVSPRDGTTAAAADAHTSEATQRFALASTLRPSTTAAKGSHARAAGVSAQAARGEAADSMSVEFGSEALGAAQVRPVATAVHRAAPQQPPPPSDASVSLVQLPRELSFAQGGSSAASTARKRAATLTTATAATAENAGYAASRENTDSSASTLLGASPVQSDSARDSAVPPHVSPVRVPPLPTRLPASSKFAERTSSLTSSSDAYRTASEYAASCAPELQEVCLDRTPRGSAQEASDAQVRATCRSVPLLLTSETHVPMLCVRELLGAMLSPTFVVDFWRCKCAIGCADARSRNVYSLPRRAPEAPTCGQS